MEVGIAQTPHIMEGNLRSKDRLVNNKPTSARLCAKHFTCIISLNHHNPNAVDATSFSLLQMSEVRLRGVEQFTQVSQLVSIRVEMQAVCLADCPLASFFFFF